MRRAKEIIPGKLYMGSHPAKWPKGKLKWMQENVDLVVVLAARPDPELEQNADFEYWHFPVPDSHKRVDPQIYETVVPTIVDWIRGGKTVLVCCLAGRSRSGATATLVVRELLGLSGSEALDYVRAEGRRPGAVKRELPEAELRALPAPAMAREADTDQQVLEGAAA